MRVLAQRHMIDGRWCDGKIPNSKEGQVRADSGGNRVRSNVECFRSSRSRARCLLADVQRT